MSNIVLFSQGGQVPAYIKEKKVLLDVNKDIVTAAQYPTLSIKGKVFTLVQDNERKVMTKPDDPDEVLQSLQAAVLRMNMTTKSYYNKRYTEGESDGARPICYSFDGIAPVETSPEKQANKCALCKWNQFGSRINEDGTAGKGKACSDQPHLAIADPDNLDKPLLLRVPPASIKNLKDALKVCKSRDLQYNMVVFKISFVAEAASPTLAFRPVGLLSDGGYAKAVEMFDSDIVRAIVGVGETDAPAEPQKGEDDGGSDLDAALAAKAASDKAASTAKTTTRTAKPKAEPKPEPKVSDTELAGVLDEAPKEAAKPKAEPKPKAADEDASGLLADLDAVLGALDD